MKILLLNFYESPENFHFEQAFIRNINKTPLVSLHVVHNFRNDYDFLRTAEVRNGWRKKYTEIPAARVRDYDLVISIDAPWRRDAGAVFYAAVLKAARCGKTLAFNHLLPEKGHSPFYDLLKKRRFFKVFNRVYFLEFEDPSNFPELKAGAARLRNYCVDTVYYDGPVRAAKPGDGIVIFTAGSKGRNFDVLFEAVKESDVELSVISNSRIRIPARLRGRVKSRDLNGNLDRIRSEIRGCSFVIVPVANEVINPTAGMAVAFMAMSARKPVIIRSTDWMDKYIRHKQNGYLYRDFSAASIRELINGVIADKSDWRRIGAAARKTILKRASLDALAGRILKNK